MPHRKITSHANVSASANRWAASFAIQAMLSVAAGAFGAHALTDLVDVKALGWWSTASQYLMYHALAGLMVVALARYVSSMTPILVCFCIGNGLFAGSLYAMTLTGYSFLGAITPLGGLCYLAGWYLFARQLWLTRQDRI